MFDILSYILGKRQGENQVILSGDITATDETGEGDIRIVAKEEGE